MGGMPKISTPGPIRRAPPFPYFRSKVGTLSEASPLHSGKMSAPPASLFLTLIPSSSTSLPPNYSKGVNVQGSTAVLIWVLSLDHQLVITMSYVHIMNHLMVMTTVDHGQISLATASVLMVGRTP
jgi:hypothetical protein